MQNPLTATFVLTTDDEALAKVWERQLLSPALVPTTTDALKREVQREGARVWIRDMAASGAHFEPHSDTILVVVGEPMSLPFEEAKRSSSFALSYEESRSELRRLSGLLAELAEARAVGSLMRSHPAPSPLPPPASAPARGGDWSPLEVVIESLHDLPRLLDEFRRAARHRVGSNRASVFLREGDEFAAAGEAWRCHRAHRFASWLGEHCALVEPAGAEAILDPAVRLAVRQKLAEWNARMVVPIEAEDGLCGWMAFGPKADGQGYGAPEREEAVHLGRLLSRLLAQHRAWNTASTAAREAELVRRHGPNFRLLDAAGAVAPIPVEARETAGIARREGRRVEREFGRLRVVAGPVPGTQRCWVWWDESELTESARRKTLEIERYQDLHDIGVMLSHEIANALFSISTFVQVAQSRPPQTEEERRWWPTVARDLERLKQTPHLFGTLLDMAKNTPVRMDLRKLVAAAAKEVGGRTELPEEAVFAFGHEEALEKAFRWLCREIAETRERSGAASDDAVPLLSLRTRGAGLDALFLVTLSCPGLRLEQLHSGEARSVGELPTVPVYLAREVIRHHRGTIQVGQGIDHPELRIAFQSLAPTSVQTRSEQEQASPKTEAETPRERASA